MPAGGIVADFADGNDAKITARAGAQQSGDVMANDVQLAVVADVKQPAQAALVAPQGVVAVESKENAAANTADADHPPVNRRALCAQAQFDLQNNSQLGFSLIGWRAVSSVAVMIASG